MPTDALTTLADQPITRTAVSVADLADTLAILGGRWSIVGDDLRLELKGPMARTGLAAAFAGALADELDHHPRVVVEYGGLVLTIHTHDQAAITELDLVFAARLERWLRAEGWA